MSRPIWSRSRAMAAHSVEQAAVEAQHFAAQDGREATGVHGLPQVLDHRREAARVVGEALQQLGEGPRRQQADVLGKHGENSARIRKPATCCECRPAASSGWRAAPAGRRFRG